MSTASADTRNRFSEILEAARTQDRSSQSSTMVVLSHIQQMILLMIKKGLTFYCDQDTYKSRTRFLDDVITLNKLDIRFPAIIRNFLIDGCGLFYFRPDEKLKYQIYFFNKNQYRVYHDLNGEVEEVIIIYNYKVKAGSLGLPSTTSGQNKRYVRLSITAETISEIETDTELSFDLEPGSVLTPAKKRPNTLGFIPAVEVLNKPSASGTEGEGEFDPFMEQIVLHDQLTRNIAKNIEFFGNPTLISSRPRSDLVEAGDSQSNFRPTISSQSGFAGMDSPSTRVSEPFGTAMGGGLRVPRIIANVEASDRVGYMTPDPVNGDMNRYTLLLREEIRTALGGVDEISISAGATATEIKGLMGRAQATALRKNKSFLTYGFCRLLEMMIYHQEIIFRESFLLASGLKEPKPPANDADQEAIEKYQRAVMRFEQKLDAVMKQALAENKVPLGVVGLPEDGDREVDYRYQGDVYEDTAYDVQQKSVVVRNLQELGVDSIEALKFLFPEKTDSERAEMLKGFPFRMVQQTQSAMQQFLVLLSQMLQSPHPLAPNQPLAADPRLNITPLLYRTFDHLAEELTYSGSYEPADPSFDPEPGLPGGSPGGNLGPGLNRLPAVGGANSYPGGSFGSYSPTAVAGGTGYGPFYQQPVQPVNVQLLPEQSLGSSDGFPGAGPVPGQLAIPQPGTTVALPGGTSAGYSTEQSEFTGPALGLPGTAGSADLVYQRLTDPAFLSGFYGPDERRQRSQRRNSSRR